jgi:hypothetical protein
MRARWYDPGTGEFLSVDADFSQTLDAYGYADENPLDGTDPAGLSTERVTTTVTSKWTVKSVWTKKTITTVYTDTVTVTVTTTTKTRKTVQSTSSVEGTETITVNRKDLPSNTVQTKYGQAKTGTGTVTISASPQIAPGSMPGLPQTETLSGLPVICTYKGSDQTDPLEGKQAQTDALNLLYSPPTSTSSTTVTQAAPWSASCWEDIALAVGGVVVAGAGYVSAPTGVGLGIAGAGTAIAGLGLAKGAGEDC